MLKVRLNLRKVAAITACLTATTMFSGCGDEKEDAKVPVLTTAEASGITATGAVSGGNVTSDSGAEVTERGIYWGTVSSDLTVSGSKTTDGKGTGSFTSTLAGLTTNTTYYVCAYATNSAGTGYGNVISFSTATVAPVLTTAAVTAITATTATAGGNITDVGTPPYTERGVCYATTANPTIDGSKVTSAGSGTGDFTAELTNLTAETKYYVRAYATGSAGTVYGNQVEFTTETEGFTFEEISHNFVKRETDLDIHFYDNHYVVKVNGVQKNFTIEVDRLATPDWLDLSIRYPIYMSDLSLDNVEMFQVNLGNDNWIGTEVPGPFYIDLQFVVRYRNVYGLLSPMFQGNYRKIAYRVVADTNEQIDLTHYTWEYEKIGITYGTTREVEENGINYNVRTADFKYRVKFGSETFEITYPLDVYVRK